jgi:peroxiredoxin
VTRALGAGRVQVDALLPAALLLPWAVVAFQGWLILSLMRQHGRSLLAQDDLRARLSRVEAQLDQVGQRLPEAPSGHQHIAPAEPQGLPLGSDAPDWRLPDLAGRERTLRDFLGRPLLVVFFSPQCGYCLQLAPRLGQLPADGPSVLVISEGDPDEHRRLALEHRWRCDVVLQSGWAVSSAYEANGTPTGYLLDAAGRIASELAIGAEALLALIPAAGRLTANGHDDGATDPAAALREKAAAATARARAAGLPARRGKLEREGLPPGTAAPNFNLLALDGKRHSLTEFRGRPVLLVFSDPNCGPCQELGPELAQRDREATGGPRIVLISRGDPAANRAKADQHGLRGPILLQKQWEVSKAYAMFATPVAYLIDERGVIAREVAIGIDAIRALL